MGSGTRPVQTQLFLYTVLVYTDVRDVILLVLLLYNAAVETKLGEVRRGRISTYTA